MGRCTMHSERCTHERGGALPLLMLVSWRRRAAPFLRADLRVAAHSTCRNGMKAERARFLPTSSPETLDRLAPYMTLTSICSTVRDGRRCFVSIRGNEPMFSAHSYAGGIRPFAGPGVRDLPHAPSAPPGHMSQHAGRKGSTEPPKNVSIRRQPVAGGAQRDAVETAIATRPPQRRLTYAIVRTSDVRTVATNRQIGLSATPLSISGNARQKTYFPFLFNGKTSQRRLSTSTVPPSRMQLADCRPAPASSSLIPEELRTAAPRSTQRTGRRRDVAHRARRAQSMRAPTRTAYACKEIETQAVRNMNSLIVLTPAYRLGEAQRRAAWRVGRFTSITVIRSERIAPCRA